MFKKSLTALAGVWLLLAAPALSAAHPGGHHGEKGGRFEHPHPQADWSAYPADVQTYKIQLDKLREEQKGLFEQFKQQRHEIKSLHQRLSEEQRTKLKQSVKGMIEELQSTRNEIHTLRDQKLEAWEQFHQHCLAKQWDAAKVDIQAVVAKKQAIIAKQRTLLETQQKIVERMKK